MPTPPTPSELFLLDGLAYTRSFAFEARADHIYTFSCTAEGFESCEVRLGTDPQATFTERVGRTTLTHYRARFAGTVTAEVGALPQGSAGTFQYALAERTDDHGTDADQATPVTPNVARATGQLDVGPDTDAFAFDLEAGHAYSVYCEGAFPPSSVRFTMYDPTGRFVEGYMPDMSVPGRYGVAPLTGRYFFQLSVDQLPLAVPYACDVEDRGVDDHGATFSTGTRVPEGPSVALTGELELPGDQDYFLFLARAGHAYALRCDTLPAVPCPFGSVRDATDNGKTHPVGVTRDTLLAVRVASLSGGVGPYAFTLVDLGPDEGSGPHDAVAVSKAVPVTGQLTPLGDEDFFRFEAQARHVYRVQVEEGRSVEAFLLDSPEQSLTRYDRVAGSRRFQVGTDAAVLLRVSGWQGEYRLQVEDLGLDDHADTREEATDVGGALSVSGVLDTSTDVDWFSLELQPRPYAPRITTRDTKFLLLEADGVTPVPWDAALGAWVPRAGGSHRVRADVFGAFTGPDTYRFELLPR
ncbi:hypothetical protein D7V93_17505 [Corallococcus llansteffanensis]|uniref:Uncharacterized protein n=1 Tax=Corallococcus llansteffanensis TaxID=2316731 RepID=A0A3A8PZM7_9BACT|nr:hypothetical protein D7V93_17505 [Corallococcus llansteffanensis]